MSDERTRPAPGAAGPDVQVRARTIRSGDVLRLTRDASPQFVRPITVRVIRVLTEWHTYHGWVWIECYELGRDGEAVARRELYLMPAGAHLLPGPPAPPRRRPAVPRRVAV
ncbi:hypothetical protein ACIQH6_29675 [Micromonospora orduensis]|uniref:hypothetical protein n=1 Tax=Micromonospora orduensis TaxID=1420891 RepID=UPI00382AFE4C